MKLWRPHPRALTNTLTFTSPYVYEPPFLWLPINFPPCTEFCTYTYTFAFRQRTHTWGFLTPWADLDGVDLGSELKWTKHCLLEVRIERGPTCEHWKRLPTNRSLTATDAASNHDNAAIIILQARDVPLDWYLGEGEDYVFWKYHAQVIQVCFYSYSNSHLKY